MTFKLPSTDQVRSLGDSLGMDLTDDYAKSFIDYPFRRWLPPLGLAA
jgi:amidase